VSHKLTPTITNANTNKTVVIKISVLFNIKYFISYFPYSGYTEHSLVY
jgi:hypothetical protein